MLDTPRNFIIRDAELNWAKLDKPVNPFGTEQYELQVATSDAAVAKSWSENHLNVKEKDGKFTVSLKRKAKRQDGTDNGSPIVMDGRKQPLPSGVMIGNGSLGNVKVYQYPYDMMGRKGVGSSLTAVQVTQLIEYTGSDQDDFDIVDDATPVETTSNTSAASADLF